MGGVCAAYLPAASPSTILIFTPEVLMENLARLLFFVGLMFMLIAAGLYLLSRFNLPLGRLPGDIRIEGENFTFYFPLATSLLLSILLTLLLNGIARLKK
jgi:hypothetical protein